MKLQLKVLLILAGMWATIAIFIYQYSTSTFSREYAKLEQNEMANDIKRTQKTLTTMMSSLSLLNTDWAQWDDAYQFMNDKNNKFIESTMAINTFKNAKVNLILFFDTKGKLFYGRFYSTDIDKFIPIPGDLLDQLEAETTFTKHEEANSKKTGILKTNEGYIILSSSPILTTE